MKKNSILMLLVISVVALFIIAPIANAEINIKPFKITGQIREGILYNSNPGTATNSRQESDWANRLGGTINLELPFGEIHKYSVMYDTNWRKYFNHDEFSSYDNNVNQNLDLSFNKWKVNLHQSFTSGETANSIIDWAAQRGTTQKRLRRNIVGAGANVLGDLGKLQLSGGFDYSYYSANDTYNILDKDNYDFFADAGWEIMPAIDAFVRYELGFLERRKDSMNDGVRNAITGGIRGDITSYLVGEAQIGYSTFNFKRTATAPDVEDFSGLVYSGSITNRISKNTTQMLKFAYKPEAGYNPGHAYFKSNSIEYDITHRLNKVINLNGYGMYIYNKEGGGPGQRETQKIWKAGTGLNWYINKLISLGLSYDFSYRDTNLSDNDYLEHEAIVQVMHNF